MVLGSTGAIKRQKSRRLSSFRALLCSGLEESRLSIPGAVQLVAGGLPMANVGLRSDGNLKKVTWVAVNTGETGGCSERVPGKVLCKGWPDKRNAFQLTSKRTSPWLLDEGIGMGWRGGGRCGARPKMAVCVCMWCLPGESGGMRIEIVFKEPKRGKERKLRAETADGRRWAVSRRGPRGRTRSSQGRRIISNECSSARQKMRNFEQLRDGCRAFINIIMGPEARQAGNCVARRTMCQCLTSGLTWCEGNIEKSAGIGGD